ncbi:MAG: SIMPL domain-containing protein, partial [Xanthobacteraceae bacterium]
TDVGSVEFLHSDTSKALDQARTAAIADAKRKAQLYAQAAGLTLGGVGWITEDFGYMPPMPVAAMRAAPALAAVPIEGGEDTLRVRVTVGFDVAH